MSPKKETRKSGSEGDDPVGRETDRQFDVKVVCFFQGAGKFNASYATLGFNDVANLDDGDMWPTSFALKNLTPAVEERIAALIRKAASGDAS